MTKTRVLAALALTPVIVTGGIVPVSPPVLVDASPVLVSSPPLLLVSPPPLLDSPPLLLESADDAGHSFWPTQISTSCWTMFMSASIAVTRSVHSPSGMPVRSQV